MDLIIMQQYWIIGLAGFLWAQTNVGIGTTNPTHRLHLASGTLRIDNLTGTATALATTDAAGVLGRLAEAPSPTSYLRGNQTWGGPDATDWKLLGNAGTTPATHFVGTSDAQDFRLGVNGSTRWRILAGGRHWVGANTTLTLNNAEVTVDAPAGWIAVYGQVTGGIRPAIRGTMGDVSASGPGLAGVNAAADGWGAIGVGGGTTYLEPTALGGGGAYGVGPTVGANGVYTGADNNRAGGAFAVRSSAGTYQWVYVGGYEGTIQRKIWGAGTPSTTIFDSTTSQYYILFCPEAAEALFQDQGRFLLMQSEQFVPFDSLLASHLAPPYTIHLQPWGDIRLTVHQVTARGFVVRADRVPTAPIPVSYLLQARQKQAPERLPQVDPHRFFTPYVPTTRYLTPQALWNQSETR